MRWAKFRAGMWAREATAGLVIGLILVAALSNPVVAGGQARSAQNLIRVAESVRAKALSYLSLLQSLYLELNQSLLLNYTFTMNYTGPGANLTLIINIIVNLTSEGDQLLEQAKAAYENGDYVLAKKLAVEAIKHYGRAIKLALSVLHELRNEGLVELEFKLTCSPLLNRTRLHNWTRCANMTKCFGIQTALERALDLVHRLNFTLLASKRVNYSEVSEEYAELIERVEALVEEAQALLDEGKVNESAKMIGEIHKLIASFINSTVHGKLAAKAFKHKIRHVLAAAGKGEEVPGLEEELVQHKGWEKAKETLKEVRKTIREAVSKAKGRRHGGPRH